MCAIFGSKDFLTYRKLYNKCKERGDFAYGSIYLTNRIKSTSTRRVITVKAPNSIVLSKTDVFRDDINTLSIDDFCLFLGHTQAPTSCVREFNAATSHPFTYGDWTVAHNGVITNHIELKNRVTDPKAYNDVDTSVLPALFDQIYRETGNETQAIVNTLSDVKGTFGLWIFCRASGNVYLARSGSTLYGDFITNDFSSLPQKGFQPLDEGVLYLLTREGITSVDTFSTNSPFFTL